MYAFEIRVPGPIATGSADDARPHLGRGMEVDDPLDLGLEDPFPAMARLEVLEDPAVRGQQLRRLRPARHARVDLPFADPRARGAQSLQRVVQRADLTTERRVDVRADEVAGGGARQCTVRERAQDEGIEVLLGEVDLERRQGLPQQDVAVVHLHGGRPDEVGDRPGGQHVAVPLVRDVRELQPPLRSVADRPTDTGARGGIGHDGDLPHARARERVKVVKEHRAVGHRGKLASGEAQTRPGRRASAVPGEYYGLCLHG